ncbi:MAG: tRNA pseudouridine(55) synthase TruB [Bacteroidetes bacterium]|nr:tRNA pseudouridine(55) synthase TruB [Bacteroidota bacterium]MDA0885647.1 tRNA pseudouridine(55) synthase TruB [Bacteroidota bacterium]MDA1225881.1 tRNA pseudouridine(55) synthase TruB [Bacteroidota bacterium]
MLNNFLESVTLDDISNGKMILIDKPIEWTSFDVVKYIRKSLQTRLKVKKIKVGHAGTLDPLATGLLIICIGKETKNISKYQDLSKKYTGIIKLGETTPSYDRETEINETYDYDHIDEEKVLKISKKFIGRQKQLPPIYSALKKDGKRMYKYAREKINILIEPRDIEIYDFQILNFSLPYIEFIIKCSKGTYIRSVASDYGKKLNSGSHLYELKRVSIGDFSISDALRFE